MKKIVIISGGELYDVKFYRKLINSSDLVVCADQGANNAARIGIRPNILIGDFDSIEPETLKRFKEAGAKIITRSVAKDETDTQLALDYAIELKPDEIIITATLGRRPDHAMANIFLLFRAEKAGIKCSIVESSAEIYLVRRSIKIEGHPGDLVSLLPMGKSEGVCLSGFKYPLREATLDLENPTLGVSNELTGSESRITLNSGSLLVFKISK